MRAYEEIAADLARTDRNGVPWPAAARRLLIDAAMMLDRLAAVDHLIAQAKRVSPSPTMTVYVGDLEAALGRGVSPRGIVGQNDTGPAAAADAPQPAQQWERADDGPFPQAGTHTRPTPQADRRRAELEQFARLGQPGPSPAVLPEDGCAECTEGGTKNCTAGCRPSPTVEAPRPSGLCCRAGWEAFPEPCPWHRPSDERIVDSLIGGNPDPAVDALVDKMIGPGE